jgi:hypothetical protein
MRDSKGEERYVRMDNQDVAHSTRVKALAAETAEEIMDQTFQ